MTVINMILRLTILTCFLKVYLSLFFLLLFMTTIRGKIDRSKRRVRLFLLIR